MKNIPLKQKKKILVLGSLVTLSIIGYFTFITQPQIQQRKISSVQSENENRFQFLESTHVQWDKTDYGLIIKISDSDGKLCEKWSSLDIVFRAEGLAYSGEVDRVIQTSACESGYFKQTWVPNLTQIEGDNYQKTGYFLEEPPQWVMEQIIFEGAGGTQVLSTQDIRNQYGRVPVLTPL